MAVETAFSAIAGSDNLISAEDLEGAGIHGITSKALASSGDGNGSLTAEEFQNLIDQNLLRLETEEGGETTLELTDAGQAFSYVARAQYDGGNGLTTFDEVATKAVSQRLIQGDMTAGYSATQLGTVVGGAGSFAAAAAGDQVVRGESGGWSVSESGMTAADDSTIEDNFDGYDTNNDDLISEEEYVAGRSDIKPEVAKTLFTYISNGDGSISIFEYQRASQLSPPELVFNAYAGEDLILSESEFEQMQMDSGVELEDGAYAELADLDGAEGISLSEYLYGTGQPITLESLEAQFVGEGYSEQEAKTLATNIIAVHGGDDGVIDANEAVNFFVVKSGAGGDGFYNSTEIGGLNGEFGLGLEGETAEGVDITAGGDALLWAAEQGLDVADDGLTLAQFYAYLAAPDQDGNPTMIPPFAA